MAQWWRKNLERGRLCRTKMCPGHFGEEKVGRTKGGEEEIFWSLEGRDAASEGKLLIEKI